MILISIQPGMPCHFRMVSNVEEVSISKDPNGVDIVSVVVDGEVNHFVFATGDELEVQSDRGETHATYTAEEHKDDN